MPTTTQQAAMILVKIVADAIKEAGQIPAGHLYAILSAHGCTHGQFETLISTFKRAGLIAEKNNLLTWINERS